MTTGYMFQRFTTQTISTRDGRTDPWVHMPAETVFSMLLLLYYFRIS